MASHRQSHDRIVSPEGSDRWPANPIRPNKANSGQGRTGRGPGDAGRGDSSLDPRPGDLWPFLHPSCETKPIPAGAIAGPEGEGPSVRNKPNFPWGGHGWPWGQACETKPISAGVKLKLNRLQEKSYAVCTCLISSAKQSQFSLRCRSGDRRSRGPSVRNKANSRRCRVGRGPGDERRGGQSCKTKPIWPRCPEMGAPASPGPRPTIDCAKRSQFLEG
jgi:hypothetical protein